MSSLREFLMPSMLSWRKVCGSLLIEGTGCEGEAGGGAEAPSAGGTSEGSMAGCKGVPLLGVVLFLAAVIIALSPGKDVATSATHVGQLQLWRLATMRSLRPAHEMWYGSPQLMQSSGVGFLVVLAIVLLQSLHLGFGFAFWGGPGFGHCPDSSRSSSRGGPTRRE